ncbi:MAG: DUF3445 domain-containing protein [Paracoccaceae bacterium]|nr:DUF3445 domain-containing protein [Paracoccaceae bacterium]
MDKDRMRADFSEICQTTLPVRPWTEERTRRLPGLNPLAFDDWLVKDECFREQMAYRDHLLRTRFDSVLACQRGAEAAATELRDRVLEAVLSCPGYSRNGNDVRRPDGVLVAVDGNRHPLLVAGQLVQEDFCILQRQKHEHVLTGAILCFPAGWLLSEKMGLPLTRIHGPVVSYDDRVARGVQRVFDRLPPERPLWRANTLVYLDPDLFQPRSASDRRRRFGPGKRWIRVERQTLVKLRSTRAVVFGIHTWVVEETRAAGAAEFVASRPGPTDR